MVLSKFHSITWRFEKIFKKKLKCWWQLKMRLLHLTFSNFRHRQDKNKIKTKMLYVWHMTLFGCQWTSNPRFLNLKDLAAHMQVISNNFKPKFFNFENKCGRDYSHKIYTFIMYDIWPFLAIAWTTKFWNSKTILHIYKS